MEGYAEVLDILYDEMAALAGNIEFLVTSLDLGIERLFYPPGAISVDLADICSRLETTLNDMEDMLNACSQILKIVQVEKSIQGIVIRTVGNNTTTPLTVKVMHTWEDAVRRVEQRGNMTKEMAEFVLERVFDWASDNGWTLRFPLPATYDEDTDDEGSNIEGSQEAGSEEEEGSEEDEEFFDAVEALTD